jgi:hypothetical protein
MIPAQGRRRRATKAPPVLFKKTQPVIRLIEKKHCGRRTWMKWKEQIF